MEDEATENHDTLEALPKAARIEGPVTPKGDKAPWLSPDNPFIWSNVDEQEVLEWAG